ncbi:MAG: hypothetical protein HGB18_03530 [Candidatus Moranbacteria bacterium]|nr:hypothetical protein [Candidatus Moranbacteria bacterium]
MSGNHPKHGGSRRTTVAKRSGLPEMSGQVRFHYHSEFITRLRSIPGGIHDEVVTALKEWKSRVVHGNKSRPVANLLKGVCSGRFVGMLAYPVKGTYYLIFKTEGDGKVLIRDIVSCS